MNVLYRWTRRKWARELDIMRTACRLAGETLHAVDEILAPGITTDDINRFVHDDTLSRGCIPAPLGYRGFPKSVCTSVNEVVCHGIPGSRVLEDGDIVNVDVTHIYEGYHGDTSATFYIGEPSQAARKVTEIARKCLAIGIAEVRPGARLGVIGVAIQDYAEARGCSVVRDYAGHGIGRGFHEPPTVHHVGRRDQGIRMRPGMTFTIEPMINLGSHQVGLMPDGWTVATVDGSLSAQFEHTILVTADGAEILTVRPGPLNKSEQFTADAPES